MGTLWEPAAYRRKPAVWLRKTISPANRWQLNSASFLLLLRTQLIHEKTAAIRPYFS